MILSNTSIHAALDAGDLVIRPEPAPRFASLDNPECPYGTTAVDLTLGSELSIPSVEQPFSFDLRSPGLAAFLARVYDTQTIGRGGFSLQPNSFVLGRTNEYVSLPIRESGRVLAARVEGKSSRARCGLLVHFTAPTVHAGFEGTITLEMINLGRYPITLFEGMTICQLIFELVDGHPSLAPSQFHGQNTPTGGRDTRTPA